MANYLTSGQMAEANCISKKALRVYREKGILAPHHDNPASGRCYYEIKQSGKLDMIVRLQEIGMSLDEIKQVNDEKDVGALREKALVRLEAIDAELQRLSIARQAAEELALDCMAHGKRPLLDQIMLENLPERHALVFELPLLDDKGLDPESAEAWEWVIRHTKRSLLDRGYPLSLFRDVHALRSWSCGCDGLPKRDRSFVFVNEALGAIFEKAERIPGGQHLSLYLDRGYDESGCCLSDSRIRRMMDYMAAKGLEQAGDVIEEILFRLPYLIDADNGLLYRICIPVKAGERT